MKMSIGHNVMSCIGSLCTCLPNTWHYTTTTQQTNVTSWVVTFHDCYYQYNSILRTKSNTLNDESHEAIRYTKNTNATLGLGVQVCIPGPAKQLQATLSITNIFGTSKAIDSTYITICIFSCPTKAYWRCFFPSFSVGDGSTQSSEWLGWGTLGRSLWHFLDCRHRKYYLTNTGNHETLHSKSLREECS